LHIQIKNRAAQIVHRLQWAVQIIAGDQHQCESQLVFPG
jgi:hypothetical protein